METIVSMEIIKPINHLSYVGQLQIATPNGAKGLFFSLDFSLVACHVTSPVADT